MTRWPCMLRSKVLTLRSVLPGLASGALLAAFLVAVPAEAP